MLKSLKLDELGLPGVAAAKAPKKILPFDSALVYIRKEDVIVSGLNLSAERADAPFVKGAVPFSVWIVEKTSDGYIGYNSDVNSFPFGVTLTEDSIAGVLSKREWVEDVFFYKRYTPAPASTEQRKPYDVNPSFIKPGHAVWFAIKGVMDGEPANQLNLFNISDTLPSEEKEYDAELSGWVKEVLPGDRFLVETEMDEVVIEGMHIVNHLSFQQKHNHLASKLN